MSMLTVRNLCKSFGETKAVDNVSFDVQDGEMLCLLGPSGCGKTTLLMTLSGFLSPDDGTIEMDGSDVTNVAPEKRPTSLVFQNYALFPHLTVFENIEFGLRTHRVPRSQIKDRVEQMLHIVELEGKGGRSIHQLSGGQQQRVALARALVMKPKVLLLDEPLSNLDAKLRVETRQQIRQIQQSVGITCIFVTHDQEEALTMADRIAVMNRGKIIQFASPRDIYYAPTNHFVADFIGKSNFFEGSYDADRSTYTLNSGKVIEVDGSHVAPLGEGKPIFAIRPEFLKACKAKEVPQSAANRLAATIAQVTFLGELTLYVAMSDTGEPIRFTGYGDWQQFHEGDTIEVYWDRSVGQILAR